MAREPPTRGAGVEFSIFGVVRASARRREVDLGPPRQKLFLAMLLVKTGRVISLDRLTDLLWGDEPPARAVHTIRVYVARLRQAVEEDPARPRLLVTTPGGYRLDVERDAVDVLRFQDLAADGERLLFECEPAAAAGRLEQALALWSDQPLAEFPYHPFATAERDRLVELRRETREALADAQLAVGRGSRACADLRAVVAEDPLRERAWRLLALALYRDGRLAEAEQACRDASAALAEVGLDPGRELRDLEAAILRQDPALGLAPTPGLHNLPVAVDRFVGRSRELEVLAASLKRSRLVTLTGPGGTGKTRLAIEGARRLVGRFEHGIWLADLAPFGADRVTAATLDAVEAPRTAPRDQPAAAAAYLRDRELLLLLDNCEHVIDAAADLAEMVLERCPHVRVLATSREALQIRGETAQPVAPLDTPPATSRVAAEVATCDAAMLFGVRAGLQTFDDLNDSEVEALSTILRRLDGIPLAIELTAVRLHDRSLGELAREIDDVFAVVGPGYRTALPRHRTLKATIEWSYRLLTATERAALRRLSVLSGDFDVSAATSVVDQGDAWQLLRRLAGRSMLMQVSQTPSRYRLLEPIRQFAAERLHEEDDPRAALACRDQHYAALTVDLGGERHFDQPSYQHRFLADRHHLREVARHFLETGRASAAATMAGGLMDYLGRLGFYDEASDLLESVLAARDDLDLQTVDNVLFDLAWILSLRGDYPALDDLVDTAAAIGVNVTDGRWSNRRGSADAARGELLRAVTHLERAVALARSGDRSGLHARLINLAAATAWSGDLARAATCTAKAEQSSMREWGYVDPGIYEMLHGIRLRMAGELDAAEVRLATAEEGLRTARSDFHLGVTLVERALVASELGRMAHAQALATDAMTVLPDLDQTPAFVRVRAKSCLARIAWNEDDSRTAGRLLRDVVAEAEASGIVWGLVDAGDLAAEMQLATGQDDAAFELATHVHGMRARMGLARDAYQHDRWSRLLARLGVQSRPTEENASPDRLAQLLAATLD